MLDEADPADGNGTQDILQGPGNHWAMKEDLMFKIPQSLQLHKGVTGENAEHEACQFPEH